MIIISWIIIALALADIAIMTKYLFQIFKDLSKTRRRISKEYRKKLSKVLYMYFANWLVIFYCINVLKLLS